MIAELAQAGVQIAGGLIGGKMHSDAIKHAQKIQRGQANAADLQNQSTLRQVTGMQAPGVAAYYTGLNALTGRLGLPTGGVTQAITDQTTPIAAFNAQQYLADHPGVMEAFSKANPNNLKNNLGIDPTPEAYAQWHYEKFGQFDPNWQMQATGASPITGQTAGSGIATPQAGSNFGLTDEPLSYQAGGATPATPPKSGGTVAPQSTNALSGAPVSGNPAAVTGMPGTYGSVSSPTYQTPDEYSYTTDDFKASPGFQFQLDQALKGTMATAAQTGSLRSGAAAKALQDRAQSMAYQDFANERAFDYGSNLDRQKLLRSNYENDRNYLSQRYDQGTSDIFRYTGMGQNALNTTTNAVQGYGDGAAQAHIDQGSADAQAAVAKGDIWSGLVSNIGGMASSVIGGMGQQNALKSAVQSGINANPLLF